MPHPSRITGNAMIRKLGPWIQDPGLWHINRRSVSGAVALGIFCAFIPVPFQMFVAALGAILFRVNILIAVPMVWVSNPFTMPPLFYFCYRVGVWILGTQTGEFSFELSFEWLTTELAAIWEPFLLGCFVVGAISALISYLVVRLMWLYLVLQNMKLRKHRKAKQAVKQARSE